MKKTSTIKTRIIAAILGTITVISTASAAAVTSVSADEEVTFANAIKAATGSLYLHTEYKGINIDAKNPKEETVRLWNEGFNLWKGDGLGKFERNASSGVAACF